MHLDLEVEGAVGVGVRPALDELEVLRADDGEVGVGRRDLRQRPRPPARSIAVVQPDGDRPDVAKWTASGNSPSSGTDPMCAIVFSTMHWPRDSKAQEDRWTF